MTTMELVQDFNTLAERIIKGDVIGRDEALALLHTPDDRLLDLLAAAYRIRFHHFGNKVKLNMIINAKSGLCPEDCGYCSQSSTSDADIPTYGMIEKEQIVAGAAEAIARKAGTYCIVLSGRKASKREVADVIEAVKEIKATSQLHVCACLGLVTQDEADALAASGVDRFNHNLNTSEQHYSHICSTHTFVDRLQTIENVKAAGISPCSGCIVGLGEAKEDVVDIAFDLRDLDVDSIPVNFLNPIAGTQFANYDYLDPRYCLKVLAMFRFVNPSKEIRVSGGRERNLRSLQPMALYPANSIFVGDYLTTAGQLPVDDWKMIEDLGFEIESPEAV